jgi:hypothetical protein
MHVRLRRVRVEHGKMQAELVSEMRVVVARHDEVLSRQHSPLGSR